MSRVLLDTDILSEIIKKKHPIVAARAADYLTRYGRFTTSAISVLEIVYGFARVNRHQHLQQFMTLLAGVEVLGFDDQCAELAGRLYADLEMRGRPIGLSDVMIASIALHHALPIATGNSAHFGYAQDAGYLVSIDDWRSPAPPPHES